MRHRLLVILVAVLTAAALVAGTWAAASHFQSPAQREASAQAPTPGPVLVTVARGDLTERTTLMANAAAATSQKVALPVPEGRAVLTRAGVDAGGSLTSGQVAAWVNDRPVIVLRGTFPLYRDLGPGDTGNDVVLLQQALTDLGYGLVADGVLGTATVRALTGLYHAVGADAPTRPATDAPPAAGASAQPTAQVTPSDAPARGATDGSGASQSQRTEVFLPLSEVLILPTTPVTVTAVPNVGTLLTGDNAYLTTSDGGLTLTTSITGPVSARVVTGMSATATLGTTSVPVSITSVSPQTQGPDASASQSTVGADADAGSSGGVGVRAVLTPQSGDLPQDWEGHSDVLVTLDLTEPLTNVLILPERAIATAADGTSSVLAVGDDGSLRQTPVTRLACVNGTCAIAEPDAGAGVREGTQVRVDR